MSPPDVVGAPVVEGCATGRWLIGTPTGSGPCGTAVLLAEGIARADADVDSVAVCSGGAAAPGDTAVPFVGAPVGVVCAAALVVVGVVAGDVDAVLGCFRAKK